MVSKERKRKGTSPKRRKDAVSGVAPSVVTISMPEDAKAPEEPNEANMCAGCEGFCCRLQPELSVFDVVRINEAEGKPVQDFVNLVAGQDDNPYLIRAMGMRVKMMMRQEGGRCIFLNPSARLKCSVEASKPSICLAYPFKFYPPQGELMTSVLCPPANLSRADRVKISAEVLRSAAWEWERQAEMVADWNASAKGDEDLGAFFAFAAKEINAERTSLGSMLRKARRLFRKR